MYKRGSGMGEQHVPDTYPINSMYQDLICHKPPGVTVFVTGDGAGFQGEEGLDATLCNMHNNGCIYVPGRALNYFAACLQIPGTSEATVPTVFKDSDRGVLHVNDG